MDMSNVKQIVNIIFNGVTIIISILGLLWGGWSLFEGFTGDQPESKRRGFTIIVVAFVVVALLLVMKPIVMNLITDAGLTRS